MHKLHSVLTQVLIAITALCVIITLSKVNYGIIAQELQVIGLTSRYGVNILWINTTTAICCGILLPGCLFVSIFHIAMLIMSIRRPDLQALVIVVR